MSDPGTSGLLPVPVAHPYRDQALARVTSAPPDADYERADRLRWRIQVARLAARLDRLHNRISTPPVGGVRPEPRFEAPRRESLVLRQAFRAFLPLVDPEWWRAFPDRRPNARARRQIRKLRKRRQRARRALWTRGGRGDLELRACDALELFLRAGDDPGIESCLRLFEVMADPAATVAVNDD